VHRARTEPQRLPADFVPVAFATCGTQVTRLHGRGEWMVTTQHMATTELDTFIEAMRLPDDPRPSAEVDCPAVARGPLILFAVDGQGRQLTVRAPRTVCSDTKEPVKAAYATLHFVPTGSYRERQLRTEEMVAADCVTSMKPSVVEPDSATRKLQRSIAWSAPPASGRVRMCLYDLSSLPDTMQGPGTFSRAAVVSAEAFNAARLTVRPSAGRCATRSTRLAVVQGAYVELDGCRRWYGLAGSGVISAEVADRLAALARG
jgi:hypothetical protein